VTLSRQPVERVNHADGDIVRPRWCAGDQTTSGLLGIAPAGGMRGRVAWLLGSPRRGLGTLGATLVLSVLVTNLIQTLISPRGEFGYAIRLLLGALVIVGVALLVVASVWSVARIRRASRPGT
jgi:hypothetical protein